MQKSAAYRGFPLPAMSTDKYKRHSRVICYLYPLFNICTGTDIYRSYSPGVPPCPNGFGLVQGSMNGRGNGRGSIRNYFPGYPGYYVKSTDPLLNPQKLPLASEETCANYCKTDIECCSFQYGLKRFGF